MVSSARERRKWRESEAYPVNVERGWKRLIANGLRHFLRGGVVQKVDKLKKQKRRVAAIGRGATGNEAGGVRGHGNTFLVSSALRKEV